MSKSAYPLKLSWSLKEAAAQLAKADGVSLNQFIASAVAEKVGSLKSGVPKFFLRSGPDARSARISCAIFARPQDRANPRRRTLKMISERPLAET